MAAFHAVHEHQDVCPCQKVGEILIWKRKARLKKLLPEPPCYLLYMDHVEGNGCELFHSVCEMDLEGIHIPAR